MFSIICQPVFDQKVIENNLHSKIQALLIMDTNEIKIINKIFTSWVETYACYSNSYLYLFTRIEYFLIQQMYALIYIKLINKSYSTKLCFQYYISKIQ